MNDLLYTDEMSLEIETKLKNKFPEIKTKISCDDVHGERISVEISDDKKKDYLEFIIIEGLGSASFYIQMVIQSRSFKLSSPDFASNFKELEEIVKEIEKDDKS